MIDDKLLVERMCEGDQEAFRELVEHFKKKVYYLAYDIIHDQHEAEDISQEVFIKVYRFIHKFRKDAKLSSWIYQITVNTAIDAGRKKSKRPQVHMEDSQMESLQGISSWSNESTNNPENHTEINHLQSQIHLSLEKVSPKERSAFVMRYFNGYNIGEIAEALDVSSNTIKSFLFRAKKKIRKELSLLPNNAPIGGVS